MLSLSSLIDFLLSLLRDEDAQAEFERDPQGVLARHNLDGVTAQDVRDVQPMLADCDGVSFRGSRDHDGGGYSGGAHHSGAHHSGAQRSYQNDDDPVRVIHHVQNTHHVEREVVVRHQNHTTQEIEYKQYNTEFNYTDNSVYVADGGTYIQDSYNQDNDGVDLKGADIEDSSVVVGNENSVGNTQVTTEETTTVTESFNEDSSEDFVVVDSGNDNSTSVQQSTVESINGSYDAQPSGAAPLDADTMVDPSVAA
ncbi:IniB N-terminal domain-containing protein [Pseudonocardia saturnea]